MGGRKLLFGVGRRHFDIRLANQLLWADQRHPHGMHGHRTRDGWLFFIDWKPWHLRVQWHHQLRGWTEKPGRHRELDHAPESP